MAGLGIGLLLAGYTVGLWGICLLKNYDISFGALLKPPTTPQKENPRTTTGTSVPQTENPSSEPRNS